MNNPLSLVEVRTRTQTLADGTHIVSKTREMFYRDAQGRTRTEIETIASGLQAGMRNVNISDPVAGVFYSWAENPSATRKEYVSRAMRTPPLMTNAPPAAVTGAQPPPVDVLPRAPFPLPANTADAPRPEVVRQDLGTRDVQGIPCRAEQTITTYPTDFVGNDRPIVVTDERCVSRELGRTLQQTRDDPRSGLTTLSVESLSRDDPPAALFQPPPGYTERKMGAGAMPQP